MNVFKTRMTVQMPHQGHVTTQLEVIFVLATLDILEMERLVLVGFSICPLQLVIILKTELFHLQLQVISVSFTNINIRSLNVGYIKCSTSQHSHGLAL